MADNNNNDEAAAENESSITYVDTKIVLLQSDNPKEKLFNIIFHDFEGLPSEKGDFAVSNEFSCFGSTWQVGIYPGGDDQKSLSEGMVTVFLERCSEGRDLTVKYSIGLVAEEYRISRQIRRIFDADISIWDFGDFCSRKEITGGEDDEGYLLVDGALTIRVSMELDEFIPKNPTSSLILKLFDDENSADVVFEICEQQQKSESERDRKRAKISTANVVYHAHRFILQRYSSELSALCATSDGMAPIIITDVKPEVFRHLLYYVYGGEISNEEFVDNEKDFISAADKYGVTNLKLEAEVQYVNNTDITIDNVIDNLLYADAMNCALLKESVMDFIVVKKEKVIQRVSFHDVPGDVCKDLLVAMARHEEQGCSDGVGNDDNETDVEKTYSKMRIRDLREKLNDMGLDIDGSREALIASLMEHSGS